MTTPATERPAENGGEQPMDIADLMPQLATVSAAHVDAGITAVLGRINELRAKAKTDGLSDAELVEVKQRRSEWDELTAEKARRDTAQAEMDAAFDGIPEDAAETSDESGEGESTEATDTEQTEEREPEAVAASAETPKTPRLPLGTVTRDREPTPTSATPAAPQISIVAAAGDARHNYGDHVSSDDVATMIYNRARNIGRGTGSRVPEDFVPVATFEYAQNPDLHIKAGAGELENTRKLDSIVASAQAAYRAKGYQQALVAGGGPQALVAAGLTMPYVIDYSVDCIGVEDRPIKSGLPGATADRGGIQFRRDVDALGNGPVSASGLWTLATDANPSGATKPVWEPAGTGPVSAEVAAVTLATKFSNITARFDPEMVAAQMKAARVAHSRFAEIALLNSIHTQCTSTVVQPAEVSAARDILASFDRNQAYLRNNRRTGPEVTLRTFLPYWVKDLIRMDMVRALHTSNEEWLAVSDAAINQWFANRNINVQWLLDGRGPQSAVTASSPNVAIPAIPDQNYTPDTAAGIRAMTGFPNTSGVVVLEYPIFVDGTFVFLDGGTLDVGVVRDENLVKTNKYLQFVETFEGVYRKGVEARRCVLSLNATGSSAATITTTSLAN